MRGVRSRCSVGRSAASGLQYHFHSQVYTHHHTTRVSHIPPHHDVMLQRMYHSTTVNGSITMFIGKGGAQPVRHWK